MAAFTQEQVWMALGDRDVADAMTALCALGNDQGFEPGSRGAHEFLRWCRAMGKALCDDSEHADERTDYLTDQLMELDPELIVDPARNPGFDPPGLAGMRNQVVELVLDAGILDTGEWYDMRDDQARAAAEDAAFERARDEGRI